MSELAEPDELGSIMSIKVATIRSALLLKDALKKMVKRNIGCVVVVDRGKPVGIVTERDISRQVAKGPKTLGIQVKRVMSSPLISVTPTTRNQEAMEMMLKHGIRRLPIMDRGRLVGIVTDRDLLRWVVKITYEGHTPFEIKDIFARPNVSKS